MATAITNIRTAPYKFRPRSGHFQTLTRKLSRWFPRLRPNVFFMCLDGHLAKEIPMTTVLHGQTIEDKYKYLEHMEPEDEHYKDFRHFVQVEQGFYTLHDMDKDLQGGKFRLWSEIDCRVVTTTREGGYDAGEERIGEFLYYTRSLEDGGADLGFYRKRPGQSDNLGEELINPHELKKKYGYQHCQIGLCRVSSDGSMLAYTLSVEGGDRYICHIRSLTNNDVFHVIRGSNIVSIEFGDAGNFFYTECNELNRPYRVMSVDIHKGVLSRPQVVYSDEDEKYFVDVRKTKDGRYLTITSDAKSHGNVLLLPASYPRLFGEDAKIFAQGPLEIAGKDSWGWLEHHNGDFFMVTSKDAPNFKIVRASAADVIRGGRNFNGWTDFVPHRDNVQIQDVDLFKTHLVLYENNFGFERSQEIRIIDLRKEDTSDRSKDVVLHFPPMVSVTPGLNKNWHQTEMCFLYSTLTEPTTECVYRFDSARTPEVMRKMAPTALYATQTSETLSPWDYMWPYTVYRDTVTSHDGVEIPITIAHRRDLFTEEITDWDPFPDTERGALIYVYGSYGEVPSMHFQVAPFMYLLRRRWVVAFAHVRGGGEKLGWEEMGKGKTKINSTMDFVACCRHLVDMNYTRPDDLVAMGSSAGCVPIAAAANMHGKELFDFGILRAPFLDITSTMINPDLPLSLAERDVWGDPLNNAEDFELLKKYDPYYGIRDDIDYPGFLVSAALDDDRVPPWNAMKYVARLREQRTKRGIDPLRDPLLLRLYDKGGHYVWGEHVNICEEIRWLCHKYAIQGPGTKPDDMDVMTTLHNQAQAGIIDEDDAKKAFLKWDSWEDEKRRYYQRMLDVEARLAVPRLVPKKKTSTFYWHHTEEQLETLKNYEMPPGADGNKLETKKKE
eukprot:PhM_4_TR6550/c0_g1_i1/m.105058